MKRMLTLLLALAFTGAAYAQSLNKLCYPTGTGLSCQDVTATNPLPTTSSQNAAASSVTSTPTIQAGAYVSGNCVGGFNSVAIANNNGQSGFLTSARAASVAGGTETLTIYLFSASPTASTCTDKSTFTLNTADLAKLIANPVNTAVTLSAPTGATPSFGSADFAPPRPFQAGGSASSGLKTIFYALVAGSSFTPANVSDLQVTLGAALN